MFCRKQIQLLEEAFAKREERLQNLFNVAHTGTVVLSVTHCIVYCIIYFKF